MYIDATAIFDNDNGYFSNISLTDLNLIRQKAKQTILEGSLSMYKTKQSFTVALFVFGSVKTKIILSKNKHCLPFMAADSILMKAKCLRHLILLF